MKELLLSIQIIAQALMLVPAAHISTLKSFQVSTECGTPNSSGKLEGGFYSSNSITMCSDALESPGIFPQDKKFFVLHEVGHAVWYERLNDKERDAFCKLFSAGNGRYRVSPGNDPLRSASPVEGFADFYAHYLMASAEMRKAFPELWKFYKEIVFKEA